MKKWLEKYGLLVLIVSNYYSKLHSLLKDIDVAQKGSSGSKRMCRERNSQTPAVCFIFFVRICRF